MRRHQCSRYYHHVLSKCLKYGGVHVWGGDCRPVSDGLGRVRVRRGRAEVGYTEISR
jgi:hypothetical protein